MILPQTTVVFNWQNEKRINALCSVHLHNDRARFIEKPVYNRNLKEIARLAGIIRNISNKTARSLPVTARWRLSRNKWVQAWRSYSKP